MTKFLLVGLGGCVGSMLRYGVGELLQRYSQKLAIPVGTLLVNVVGCFVIGALTQFGEARGGLSDEARALWVVGILGGFTTFSSFGNETWQLWRDGQTTFALVNIASQLVLGLAAVGFGRFCCRVAIA